LAAYPKTATNLVVRLGFGQSAFGPNIAEVPPIAKVLPVEANKGLSPITLQVSYGIKAFDLPPAHI
jgi:hypothetical protein